MPSPQLFVTITSPTGGLPFVDRTFQVAGNISWLFVPSNWSLTGKSVTVQFGPGGPTVGATFPAANLNWQCTGTVSPAMPWGSRVELTVRAEARFRIVLTATELDFQTLTVTTTFMVQLFPAIAPTVNLNPFTSPIVAAQMPVSFMFTGSATSPQAPIQVVQYKVEGGQSANAVDVSTSRNWSQWRITLPLPPTAPGRDHTLTICATDIFGTVGETSKSFAVQPQPPIVIPPGSKTTFSGAPTTSSITSWTRLEPQCTDADIGTSSGARVFDPLWMLTRQWQMGEFQAEDAGTPVQARVRATSAMLTRRYSGELPKPTGGPGSTAVAAPAYDPTRTPLEVLVERRRMRAADASDVRMLTFAVEAGLHFLRMLELQSLSKSYRSAFLTRLALQPLTQASSALVDDATSRYMQSMVGRAPDGRQLADLLRTTGAAQLVLDTALNIETADRQKVQQAATAWLAWYDSMYSEPTGPTDDAWNPPHLEYALSVGTRLSANAQDDMTFSATEIDGPIDWSSFDVNTQASLTTTADQSFTSIVEATIPAPVNFPGVPAPRFWEMEDARIAYGLVPVGPTDLAHLVMIEYASSYGNDWFVVPLSLPVGSVTRVDSLVVTDTFGVRSLVRPIGDPAIPPAHFSLWQSAYKDPPFFGAAKIVTNRFFLPPTLSRTMDSAPLEDVLFMRDEMANLAWAIERTVESPIEQPAQRYEAPDAVPSQSPSDVTNTDLPRYLLSSYVPPNWIPLLPVQLQLPNTPGQILSRLKLGAVLQPDVKKKVHAATGEVLLPLANLLLYDEEVPREGARITRQRRLARWTDGSTWLWTSFRNQVGRGEGASALKFDQILEPRDTTGAQ
jgi:hypothetical protein